MVEKEFRDAFSDRMSRLQKENISYWIFRAVKILRGTHYTVYVVTQQVGSCYSIVILQTKILSVK